MKLAASLILAIVAGIASPVSGQQSNTWSYQKLQREADVVLIVYAQSGKEAPPPVGTDQRLIRMESTLKVLVPLKGDVESETIALVHYIPKEGVNELDSKLLRLKYGSRNVTLDNFDGTVQDVMQPACQYLVFLKRHADGTFEPATGHYNSLTSIVELPHRYVEPPSPSAGSTASH